MKSRILVVDDNIDLTSLLGKALERFGYEVAVENDSTFALDTTHRIRPNLILLDVMMPHRDGGEVLHDLRHDIQLRHIPVILLTGLAREAYGLANQGGIQSLVLSKPIELKLLLHEIDRHLEENMTFRQQMTERVERETGIPVPARGRNAFGGPDSDIFRRSQGMNMREMPGQAAMSPFRRMLRKGSDDHGVDLPR